MSCFSWTMPVIGLMCGWVYDWQCIILRTDVLVTFGISRIIPLPYTRSRFFHFRAKNKQFEQRQFMLESCTSCIYSYIGMLYTVGKIRKRTDWRDLNMFDKLHHKQVTRNIIILCMCCKRNSLFNEGIFVILLPQHFTPGKKLYRRGSLRVSQKIGLFFCIKLFFCPIVL